MTPSKVHNSSKSEPKDIEMVAMWDKEFESLVLKMNNELKEYSTDDWSKEINSRPRRKIQQFDEK
jgi:hypothetical protein